MHKNNVKELISKKMPVLGCIINGPYPALVELLGLAGFHFVFIDSEHSSLSIAEIENLIRASELRNITPLVRVPDNNPKTILKVMDIGAMGIIVPDIRNRAEAEAAVRASKYAPMGERGLATTRSANFGFGKKGVELFQEANDETMVIVLIESQEGLSHAEEILSVDGVDGCFIGTSDLSMSMGVFGEINHPKVLDAVQDVLKICLDKNKVAGIVVRAGESPKRLLDMGFSMVFTNIHTLIRSASKSFIEEALSNK